MALYKCGGGKTLTETTLWTNSSPTASFASQDVTLLYSIDNYDYIKFTSIGWNGAGEIEAIVSVDYLNTTSSSTGSSSVASPKVAVSAAQFGSGAMYIRTGYRVSSTSIRIGGCVRTDGGSGNNKTNIPIRISGLKL